jgi:predicted TIM-barrel fold metal-dependent hydrolase
MDHLAGLHAELPADNPTWGSLRALADGGAWMRLSGWYRLRDVEPHAGLLRSIARVADPAGDHLVWESDWPHTAFAPDALPAYASTWQPVLAAPGVDRAGAVRRSVGRLYAA